MAEVAARAGWRESPRHGTEVRKPEIIPRILSTDMALCQLFSEPGAGSDLASLATRAVLDGDEFVVNGQKVWNSAARFCDWGFILVRTDPDLPKHAGITFLLLDMSSPGVEVRPLVQINRSAHFNEVFLSDVRVPAGNVVGEINGGWKPTRSVMSNESAFVGGGRGLTSPKLIELARIHGRCDGRQRSGRRLGPIRVDGPFLGVDRGRPNEVQRNNIGERTLGLPREPRPDKDMPWRDLPR